MRRFLATTVLALGLTAVVFADEKGTVIELDGLKSTAPAAWKKQEPTNKMRSAQFKIAKVQGEDDDAELVVFTWPEGQGGSLDDNLGRWKKSFKAPAGEKAKTEKFKVGKHEVTVVEVEGTYNFNPTPNNPNPQTVDKTGYRALYVYFPSDNKNHTMRFVGPTKTVEGQKKAFVEWVKNFK